MGASIVDVKGKPILEGEKAIGDPVGYRKLMKVMIFPNNYKTYARKIVAKSWTELTIM